MRCSGCGRELSGKMKFCKYCGTPIESQEMETDSSLFKCWSCGTPLKKGDSFCTHCGAPIIIGDPGPVRRGKFFKILVCICILLTIGGAIGLYYFRDRLFHYDEGEYVTHENDTPDEESSTDEGNTPLAPTGQDADDEEDEESSTDEGNTPLAPTGQDADDEEERKKQAEQATYTIICQDLNGVTLFTDSKEGDVGIQITVDPPTIDGYITQSDSQNIELVSDNSKNILTFKYSPARADTTVVDNTEIVSAKELGMSIPSDAITNNGHSYYLYDNDCENWDEILAFCENKGGYPAVINDSEENELLYEYMISMGRKAAFIGYTDRDTEGIWKWTEGKDSDFTDWGTNNEGELEPNSDAMDEDYAQYDINMHDGHWNDCAFGWDTNSFICEWDGVN